MDLTQLANLGEFIGGVAVLVTLLYLVIQVRQGNADSRASARQALIDDWAQGVFEIGKDRELCRISGSGIAGFDGLSHEDKTQFVYLMARFVYNIRNGLLLHEQGILDLETLDEIGGFVATAVLCPGGASWWASFPHPQAVRNYIADYQERHRDTIVPQDELTPYAPRSTPLEWTNIRAKLVEALAGVLTVAPPRTALSIAPDSRVGRAPNPGDVSRPVPSRGRQRQPHTE